MVAANESQVDSTAMLKLSGEISAKLGEQTELLRSLRVGSGSLSEADGNEATAIGNGEKVMAEVETGELFFSPSVFVLQRDARSRKG